MPFDPTRPDREPAREPTNEHPSDPPSALPRGTRLGEFELLRVLGIGGFGIVYLAFDHALEREVAVKEYMPASLAGRTETMHVSLRSQSDADTFALGLKSFVNEARLLARFDHPSLLKVLRFWEANDTAYMAMPVYRGRTLKEVRAAMTRPPDEAGLRELLTPLLGAIEKLHSEGVYHRDIAPDNIIIEPDGRPVLLDFGAARRVISDKSQTLTAILKPAYAPIEQYAEAGSVKQGPWTDLYALGATVHFLLLGRPPSPATARAVHDDQKPLSGQPLPGCSDTFLHVIDWMLAPRPTDRPQSVAAVRDVLEGRAPPPVRRAAPAAPQGDWESTQVVAPIARPSTVAPASDADDEGTVIRPPQRATVLPPVAPPPRPAAASASPPAAAPAPALAPATRAAPAPPAPAAQPAARAWPVVPLLIGVVAVAAGAGLFLWPKSSPAPALQGLTPAASQVASPVASETALPALVTAPTALGAAPATAPAPPPVPVPAPAPAPVPTPAATAVVTQTPASAAQAAQAAAPVAARAVPPPPAAVPAVAAPKPEARLPAKAAAPLPARAPVAAAPAVSPGPAAETVAPPVEPSRPVAVVPAPSAPAAKPALAAAPAPAKLVGPKERCGSRLLVALFRCMERECAKPELRQHPECVVFAADQERRANPTQ